jgi:hypothetical protein
MAPARRLIGVRRIDSTFGPQPELRSSGTGPQTTAQRARKEYRKSRYLRQEGMQRRAEPWERLPASRLRFGSYFSITPQAMRAPALPVGSVM